MYTMTENDVKRSMRHSAKAGFSLIELLIAFTIIGILTAGVYKLYTTVTDRVNRSNTTTTIQQLKMAITSYKTEKDEYPKTLTDVLKAGLLGAKAKALPKDGWERPFVYRLTPDGKNPFELYSYGPYGKSGGKESRISAWEK